MDLRSAASTLVASKPARPHPGTVRHRAARCRCLGMQRPAHRVRHRGEHRRGRTPRRPVPARTSTTEGHIMNEILQLGQRWAEAEQRGDVAALEAMAVGNFTLVGPLGFVLDKGQWLPIVTAPASLRRHRWSGTTSTCGSTAALPSRSAGTPNTRATEASRPTDSFGPRMSRSRSTGSGSLPACSSAPSANSARQPVADATATADPLLQVCHGLGIAVTALRGPAGHGSVASGHRSPVALSISAARFSRACSGSTS